MYISFSYTKINKYWWPVTVKFCIKYCAYMRFDFPQCSWDQVIFARLPRQHMKAWPCCLWIVAVAIAFAVCCGVPHLKPFTPHKSWSGKQRCEIKNENIHSWAQGACCAKDSQGVSVALASCSNGKCPVFGDSIVQDWLPATNCFHVGGDEPNVPNG